MLGCRGFSYWPGDAEPMGEISVDRIYQLSGLPEIPAVSPAVQTNFRPLEIWLITV
jgi:hypothetical protein